MKVKKPLKQQDKFPIAVRHYEAGEITEAKKTLEQMLKSNPKDYDVLVFLGGIYLTSGDYSNSIEYFQKAIANFEKHPTAHYNLGLAYQRLNKLEDAEKSYKNAALVNPNNLDAFNNLGVICFNSGRLDEANTYYQNVLKKDALNSNALNNMGNLESTKDNFKQAEYYYRKALNNDPDNCTYLMNLSDSIIKQGELNKAAEILNKIIEIDSKYYQAYNSLGVIYLKQKKYEEADILFEKSIDIKGDFWEAYQNLGACFERMNKNSEAVEVYKHVLELNASSSKTAIKLSNIFMDEGKFQESENFLNQLSSDSDRETRNISFVNLGVSKLKQGNLDESITYSKMALEENDNVALTHYNYAHALLMKGMFEEGWKEYEWRKKRIDFEQRKLAKPLLIDQKIAGKRVLVCDEQGLGDSIQFVRLISKLKELGAYVILECSKRLIPLYKDLQGVDVIIPKDLTAEPTIAYDYHISLLSLPYYFKIDLTNIPSNIPYLKPNHELVNKLDNVFDSNYLNVGISWAGNPKNNNDKNRSCHLKELQSLFDLSNVKFYSLQVGEPSKQIQEFENNLIHIDDLVNGMPETAATINKLDLVISVDTSIAHLAGALGKEVWIMLPYVPDWRWMLDRPDSPWYPTARLFRQTKERKWADVVSQIEIELKSIIDNRFGVKKFNNPQPLQTANDNSVLYMGLTSGANFGWGVVCKYLKKELANKVKIHDISSDCMPHAEKINSSKFFQLLTDVNLNPLYPITGKENYGYSVFENELTSTSIENSKKYDKVVVASTWCKEKLEAKGINNTGLIIQGIDPEIFYPENEIAKRNDDKFIIFSGGKLELRKSQDIVIKAFEILHKKYSDMVLLNAWYNFWPDSIITMAQSNYINFDMKGNTWEELVSHLLIQNDINLQQVITLPIVPNDQLRKLYLMTDVGLFPNRCEGGTNLIMMEYMACGKPVVASYNTGHKDVLNDQNSYMLQEMRQLKLFTENSLTADWEEPSLDEIIHKLESAYHNRDQMNSIGKQAGIDLKNFTWENTANNTLRELNL